MRLSSLVQILAEAGQRQVSGRRSPAAAIWGEREPEIPRGGETTNFIMTSVLWMVI